MNSNLIHVVVDRAFIEAHPARDVLRPVFRSVDIYGSPQKYERTKQPFTRAQQLALGVQWYRAEVNNGGHEQFYWNATGIVWKDALAGLEMLELPPFAAILRESADRLGGDPPLLRVARQSVVDTLDRGLGDLDERFYALEREGDLADALIAYIRAHPDDFLFDGMIRRPSLR